MTILSDAVAIANEVTNALEMQVAGQQQILHRSFTGDGGVGAPQYKNQKRNAVVSKKTRQVRSFSGALVVSTTQVTFLNPRVVVKEHDLIILADKSGGPVIGTASPVDASGVLMTEAYLG